MTEGGAVTPLLRDPAGNETALGPGSSLYSSRSSLSATGRSAFRYDARGVRVAEEVASGSGLFTVTPCRVLDTRNPDGPWGGPHVAAGGSRTFAFQGRCGIATGARAVALNVTVAGPASTGALTFFPSDVTQPVTTSISFSAGKTRANNGILGLSLLGDLTVFNASTTPAQTIIDVSGYFKEPTATRKAFVYSPELSLLAETNATTSTPAPLYEYIWLGGRPVAQEKVGDAGALRHTLTDHLGTPLLQTNAAGAIVWRVEHEPFGNVYAYRAGTPSDQQPLRFPGQEERSSSPGRFYNVFRWYRPDLGLYSQPDPIGPQADLNLYRYANSNPVSFTDATGLQAEAIAVGAAAGCVAVLEAMPPVLAGTIIVGVVAIAGKECIEARRCGSCTPEEHAALQAAVNAACKSGPRRCSPTQDPATLAANMGRNLACAAARDTINQRCFGGGDAGHRQAADQARSAAIRCARLLRGLRAGD